MQKSKLQTGEADSLVVFQPPRLSFIAAVQQDSETNYQGDGETLKIRVRALCFSDQSD